MHFYSGAEQSTSSRQSAMVLSREPVTISFFPAAQQTAGCQVTYCSYIQDTSLSSQSKCVLTQDICFCKLSMPAQGRLRWAALLARALSCP